VTRALVVAVAAFGSALVLTPLAMATATRTGVVDRPGPLKPHSAPVPYLGGVAVFLASVIGAAIGKPTTIVPLGGAVVLGVLDDRFGLPAWVRLVAQAAIGTGVAVVVSTGVPGVGGDVLVAAAAVILMNGVNFLDGSDALAAGVVAVASTAFALLLHGASRDLGAAAAAALLGFLFYNRPPARVYLGDGGSYLLGVVLALLLAGTWAPGTRPPVAVASLLLVGLPVAEVAFAVVRRLRARRSIALGDRRHPYDLVVARGWSTTTAALVYAGAEVVLAATALGVGATHSLAGAVAALGAATAVLAVLAGACGALSPDPQVPA
jgi:UDP-GlcNAc:undecaprenyl-phosphate/decaprenyl-phosphate GlcNAc-1-phosphate transferase